MPDKQIAEKHSMDIPHLAAVEMPLNVKDSAKAIEMLGGNNKISKVINASSRTGAQGNILNANDNILELRLRKDPFHHPLQSLLNASEKVLLKISIPKESIPEDYQVTPSKYSVRDLVDINLKKCALRHKVQPVGIINKTYSFKAMADFQVLTKNNNIVQDFKDLGLEAKNFETLNKYFEKHEGFNSISDFKNSSNFENGDHNLPPPPILSPIRFPFDYRFQKNPLTTTIKNNETGELKVISKKETLKLHTIIIDFNSETPLLPAAPLIDNLKSLSQQNLSQASIDYHLLECVNWLRYAFDLKPIWLRKQLEDIVPSNLKRVMKQALPYVSYIYKSGPWRFCNVKFGVDPRCDKSFWIYQSEYFRIPGLHFNPNVVEPPKRVPLKTIKSENTELLISETLIFDGNKLPLTVTYQVGDIRDPDIVNLFSNNQKNLGNKFFRDTIDFQDGWINRQTMESLRGIIRYKLNRLVKEQPIEANKIQKIISSEYSENNDDLDEEPEQASKEDPDAYNSENDDGELVDMEGDLTQEDVGGDTILNEEEIMKKLKKNDNVIASHLSSLIGLVKQDSMTDE
ncbi:uncharacterized protein PRCAT00003660001 [Priceomyces carsonii]|uniref:uncharacterized protein n=1 Tax=Priceomyces carsonii TaxID=28549 RepID=UPI002ED8311B|nr:unnamed protein product [Priceomyces carsonii]